MFSWMHPNQYLLSDAKITVAIHLQKVSHTAADRSRESVAGAVS